MMANPGLNRRGWWLAGAVVGVILLVATAMMSIIGGADGARAAIRFTARTSLLLFLLAFAASALHRFWPNAITAWVRRYRRYLGLSFAGSHLVHAVAILAYLQADPVGFHASQQPIGYVINGIGYAYIIAMAATSFDRSAALIGPVAWRWLHLTGSYFLWFAFAKSYFPRAFMDPFYIPFAGVLLLAVAMRLAAAITAPRPAAASQMQ